MLNVVISSHLSDEENNLFLKHITKTVGCKTNILLFNNFNEHSLTKIYNNAIIMGLEKSPYFVFIHNDIIFKTKNWGTLLLNKLKNSKFDIIGVAGSTTLGADGVWWSNKNDMIGVVEHTNGYSVWKSIYRELNKGETKQVAVIDGLFMGVDCSSIEHRFDEEFDGFHMYDISFCFPNTLDGCNIGVTTDIRVLHKSIGLTNDGWEKNRKKFIEKYKNDIPFSITDYL